jgi:CheY-like chemotaxis protein
MEALQTTAEVASGTLANPALVEVRRRLLLAEDDVETRRLLAAMLRRRSYEVVEVGDGIELMQRLEALLNDGPPFDAGRPAFDAIISDIYMPGLDGLDVLAALACTHWQTPFIVITARGDENVCAEARGLGATAVLRKPCTIEEIEAALRAALPPRDVG